MNGWLILDKPLHMSSAQAVGRVKHIITSPLRGEVDALASGGGDSSSHSTPSLTPPPQGGGKFRIGHAGTLDPLATGVLILALGEATKAVQLMMDAKKAYAFEVTWGAERDTDDMEGAITQTSDKRPTLQEIMGILPQFIGEIEQTPPNYSAIKQQGKRAYAMARAGQVVELKARAVRVDSLVIASESEAIQSGLPRPEGIAMTKFVCGCGKGTYIRSLARDMGRVLGCFGHVSRLRRIKVGGFNESDAISLETLEEIVHKGELGFLKPIERVLDDILALSLSEDEARRLKAGQFVPYHGTMQDNEGIAVVCGGKLVALCELAHHQLKPKRVFNH